MNIDEYEEIEETFVSERGRYPEEDEIDKLIQEALSWQS